MRLVRLARYNEEGGAKAREQTKGQTNVPAGLRAIIKALPSFAVARLVLSNFFVGLEKSFFKSK